MVFRGPCRAHHFFNVEVCKYVWCIAGRTRKGADEGAITLIRHHLRIVMLFIPFPAETAKSRPLPNGALLLAPFVVEAIIIS